MTVGNFSHFVGHASNLFWRVSTPIDPRKSPPESIFDLLVREAGNEKWNDPKPSNCWFPFIEEAQNRFIPPHSLPMEPDGKLRQEDVLKYPGLSVAPMARHYSATISSLTARKASGVGGVGGVVGGSESEGSIGNRGVGGYTNILIALYIAAI